MDPPESKLRAGSTSAVVPRIKFAKLFGIAGILLMVMLVFGAPLLVSIALGGVAGMLDVVRTGGIAMILLSAIPAGIIGVFLVSLILCSLVAFWLSRHGGMFRVDPGAREISDGLGRRWNQMEHGQAIVVLGRGGKPYALLLPTSGGPPAALPILRRLSRPVVRVFDTLWTGRPGARFALPLFLLTDVDAMLSASCR
ncbi:hypothetical protein [Neoroseomonas rubea]|uniref:hypothetical protein n=1 Tax=Neoroseomonas rubea TaxID=2748666 RepID=UPI0018DF25A7|nr:hypothetical protein [Roseomonas rubea]